MQTFLDTILHLDVYLNSLVAAYGFWAYAILFLVIFCETGLVILPFLPGDSLLFAAGSIAATNTQLEIFLLFAVLTSASIIGNKVNYLIGRFVGPQRFLTSPILSRFFKPQHLAQAQAFYAQHGGKTIILARFLPIFRTFVPFVAGISSMSLPTFTFYNIVSAILWIGSLLTAGYFFGTIPAVKAHFSLVVVGIIAITVLPAAITFLKQKVAPSRR